MNEIDPYSVPAGRELDAFIHHRILKRALTHFYPSYSTNNKEADKLRRLVEEAYSTPFVTGTTGLEGKRWFARYEVSPGNPAEVLAETYPLAICRLALLRASEE